MSRASQIGWMLLEIQAAKRLLKTPQVASLTLCRLL